MKVNCSHCDAEISKPSGKVKSSDNLFCNNECRSRFYDKDNRSKHEKLIQIINYIKKNENATRKELASNLNINKYTIKNYLRQLREADKLTMERNGKHSWIYKLKFQTVSLKRGMR